MSQKQRIVQSIGMALIMSCCMSFVMAVKNMGFPPNFIAMWLPNALIGFLVAIPLSFFLPPVIQKWTKKLGID